MPYKIVYNIIYKTICYPFNAIYDFADVFVGKAL